MQKVSYRNGVVSAAAFMISILVALLCVEGFLRAYFSLFQDYDVEMWRYAVHLKNSVSDARSHVHVPLATAKIMGEDVKINSKGLRDREFPYEKTEGVKRILVIGDSVTFGFWVPVEKTYPKLLEKYLNESWSGKYEVINSWIGNYNTVQEMAAFRTEFRKYSPDFILLGFYVNDPEPTQKYPENFLSRHSMAYAFLLSACRKIRANVSPGMGYLEYYSSLYEGENWTRYEDAVREMPQVFDLTKSAIVLLPELHATDPYPFDKQYSKAAQSFRDVGYSVFDATSSIVGESPESLWVAPDDVHPNARGHELIAKYILNSVFHGARTWQ